MKKSIKIAFTVFKYLLIPYTLFLVWAMYMDTLAPFKKFWSFEFILDKIGLTIAWFFWYLLMLALIYWAIALLIIFINRKLIKRKN